MKKNQCHAKSSSHLAPRRNATAQKTFTPTVSSGPEREGETFWPPHLEPLPIQLEGVEFVFAQGHESFKKYLGYDPGLGKTIMAALILNRLNKRAPTKCFYVCPPFLVANTIAEFEKWCGEGVKIYLLPSSKLQSEKAIEDFKTTLDLWPGETLLIIDEAHQFKNEKSKRSQGLFKKVLPHFNRVVAMSGTPLPNGRPIELWPVLKYMAPKIFGGNFFEFGLKYCGAFKNQFGWDFSGFTNRPEFRARITRTFLKRVKKDVLNLPPKIEGLLTLGENMPAEVRAIEKEILRTYSENDLVQGVLAVKEGAETPEASLHLATYLRLLGEHKVKYVLPFIEDLLEETKENILIFCTHRETVEKLKFALASYNPLVITGDTPVKERNGIVKEYQENKERRVFIGNIKACGVGFTLTKATRVLFTEFSWVDGDNSQAADRAHRIGQGSTVLVQYAVLKDSIDAKRMSVLLNKRKLAI